MCRLPTARGTARLGVAARRRSARTGPEFENDLAGNRDRVQLLMGRSLAASPEPSPLWFASGLLDYCVGRVDTADAALVSSCDDSQVQRKLRADSTPTERAQDRPCRRGLNVLDFVRLEEAMHRADLGEHRDALRLVGIDPFIGPPIARVSAGHRCHADHTASRASQRHTRN